MMRLTYKGVILRNDATLESTGFDFKELVY